MHDTTILAAFGGAKICAAITLATVLVVRSCRTAEVEGWVPAGFALLLVGVASGISDLAVALSAARSRRALAGGAALDSSRLETSRALGPDWSTATVVALGLAVVITYFVGMFSASLATLGLLPGVVVVGFSTVRLVDEFMVDRRWRAVHLRPADEQGRTCSTDAPRAPWSPPPAGVLDAALCGLRGEAEEWTYVQLVLIREERPSPALDASWFHDADLATTNVITRATDGAGKIRLRAPREPFGPFDPPPSPGAHGRGTIVVGGRERRVRVVLRARFGGDVVQFAWPPRSG